MPTVLRENGYGFHFYASDGGEPAHVHVSKNDGTAKVWLEPILSVKYFSTYKASE